ncbi:MAG TPA: hypothetical protein VGR30_04330 [Candidatus Binatia bacterium]|nr:hypothetical protein [Candidatus Binatia bacterium]
MKLREEAIAIGKVVEGHELEKKGSKMFSVGAFGMLPAPTESLALDVHQTALNEDLRP